MSYSESVFFYDSSCWSYNDLKKWITDGCDLEQASKVEELRCSSCGLTELPPEIELLVNLKYLRCYNNKLNKIPKFISNLNLVYLDCSFNNIESLNNIGEIPSLTHLLVTGNNLTKIQKNITWMTQLKVLYCGQNDITFLPSQLCQLINLQSFSYDENKITMPQNVKRHLSTIPNYKLEDIKEHHMYYSSSHYLCLTKHFHYVQNNSIDMPESEINTHVFDNKLLSNNSKKVLSRYITSNRIHDILNLSFTELLLNIIHVSSKDGKYNEFFKILNEKIEPSRYPSFNNQFMMIMRCLDELYTTKRKSDELEQPNKKNKK